MTREFSCFNFLHLEKGRPHHAPGRAALKQVWKKGRGGRGAPEQSGLAQGRARTSLAKLYNWRYKDLGDLPNVVKGAEYLRANPGFAYEYQFVDVPDFRGRGEHEPVPYFYQVAPHLKPEPSFSTLFFSIFFF